MSKYIEYRRVCRQCEEYTECSASWQPRVRTVQGDHIAGLDLHRDSYISDCVQYKRLCTVQETVYSTRDCVQYKRLCTVQETVYSTRVMESCSHGVMES